jgi:hypothetical protein
MNYSCSNYLALSLSFAYSTFTFISSSNFYSQTSLRTACRSAFSWCSSKILSSMRFSFYFLGDSRMVVWSGSMIFLRNYWVCGEVRSTGSMNSRLLSACTAVFITSYSNLITYYGFPLRATSTSRTSSPSISTPKVLVQKFYMDLKRALRLAYLCSRVRGASITSPSMRNP